MNNKKSFALYDFFQTQEMTYVLSNDVREIWKILDKDDSQTMRRAFIRALFAAIEGALYRVKIDLIYAHDKEYINLLPEELVLLSEKIYHIDKNGNAKSIDKFSPTKNTFLFIYNTLFRYTHNSYRIDKKDKYWSFFITILKARNRLMHPKTIDDLNVTDIELKQAKDLLFWIAELQIRAIFSSIKIEGKFNPEIRREINSGKFWEKVRLRFLQLSTEKEQELSKEAKKFIDELWSE